MLAYLKKLINNAIFLKHLFKFFFLSFLFFAFLRHSLIYILLKNYTKMNTNIWKINKFNKWDLKLLIFKILKNYFGLYIKNIPHLLYLIYYLICKKIKKNKKQTILKYIYIYYFFDWKILFFWLKNIFFFFLAENIYIFFVENLFFIYMLFFFHIILYIYI